MLALTPFFFCILFYFHVMDMVARMDKIESGGRKKKLPSFRFIPKLSSLIYKISIIIVIINNIINNDRFLPYLLHNVGLRKLIDQMNIEKKVF